MGAAPGHTHDVRGPGHDLRRVSRPPPPPPPLRRARARGAGFETTRGTGEALLEALQGTGGDTQRRWGARARGGGRLAAAPRRACAACAVAPPHLVSHAALSASSSPLACSLPASRLPASRLALQRVDASPLTPLSGELEPQPGLRLVPPVRLLRSEWSAALDAALDADGVQPPT